PLRVAFVVASSLRVASSLGHYGLRHRLRPYDVACLAPSPPGGRGGARGGGRRGERRVARHGKPQATKQLEMVLPTSWQNTALGYSAPTGRDRIAAVAAEGARRDLRTRCCLAALVFAG